MTGSTRTGSIRPEARPWRRYVALGDSMTEGLGDPDTDGGLIGWADRLAALLSAHTADLNYANLAVRGRRLHDIAGRQVDRGLELQPDLVSIIGGGNDILRPGADPDALAAALEEAVARIRATGSDVLMATPSDPAGAPIVERTRGKAAVYVGHLWSIAERQGAYLLNQWALTFLRDWRMWGRDRIHMSPEGHRRVALAAYESLGHTAEEADWRIPLPPQPRPGRLEAFRDNATWAREYAAPWVGRRLRGTSSGDNVPPKRPSLTPVRAASEDRADD
ncbi:SGNH/GDSL hydrolase family protein [Ornithinimicrobium murale]|uniref:SGNH/GDSL hydrolase family protein n=1 Tax=Ornithinimicrobium murale TaxID=1050153 RepID=UPI000E0D7562|nr:SGNH/GDSL hydrolase family protein [Ornithinimicrobium murale]